MQVSQAVDYCLNYHRQNSRKNTLCNYAFILNRFKDHFGQREISSLTPDEILAFLSAFFMNQKAVRSPKQCICLRR